MKNFEFDYTKPFWQDETCNLRERVISIRMINSNKDKSKEIEYYKYLNGIKLYLGDRISRIGNIDTFYNGTLCCVIYLKDMDPINY